MPRPPPPVVFAVVFYMSDGQPVWHMAVTRCSPWVRHLRDGMRGHANKLE